LSVWLLCGLCASAAAQSRDVDDPAAPRRVDVPAEPPLVLCAAPGGNVKVEPLETKKLRARCSIRVNQRLPECVTFLATCVDQ